VRSVCGLLYIMQYVSSALFLTASGNDCSIFYLILFFAQVSLVTIILEQNSSYYTLYRQFSWLKLPTFMYYATICGVVRA
jgi:hypothetical protein